MTNRAETPFFQDHLSFLRSLTQSASTLFGLSSDAVKFDQVRDDDALSTASTESLSESITIPDNNIPLRPTLKSRQASRISAAPRHTATRRVRWADKQEEAKAVATPSNEQRFRENAKTIEKTAREHVLLARAAAR
jgi:hypothetical protein